MLSIVNNIRGKKNRVHIIPTNNSNGINIEKIVEEKICKICYGSGRCLISPCNCEGSIGFIHKRCLLKWIKISESKKCEICQSEYKVNIITRNRLNFWQKMRRKFKITPSYQISIYDL
jgi:hypothetical protein